MRKLIRTYACVLVSICRHCSVKLIVTTLPLQVLRIPINTFSFHVIDNTDMPFI